MKKLLSIAIITSFTLFFAQAQQASLSININTEEDFGIADVTATINDLQGNLVGQLTEESAGVYTFTGLSVGESYTLNLEKEGADLNGLSTLDIVLMIRHILGITPITSTHKLLAMDVNESQSISVIDNVLLRRLILGIDTELTGPSWLFWSSDLIFPDPFPLIQTPNTIAFTVSSENETLDVEGTKVGDVSGSAIPD